MTQPNKHKAPDLLAQAAALLETRGAQYDRAAQGDTFAPVANAMSQLSRGRVKLLPKDVALLLALVKITRSYSATSPETVLDSYHDGLAYLAKAGENDLRILAEASHTSSESMFQELAESHNIPEWAVYLTLDKDQSVWAWKELPEYCPERQLWFLRVPYTRYQKLAKIAPANTINPEESLLRIPNRSTTI